MAWTYDGDNLEKHLNWIRLRIGDTDTNDQQLTDGEIESLLSLHDSRVLAAAAAADMLAAKYSRYGAQAEAEVFRVMAATIYAEAGPHYLC